jgi:hypothetical protein
MCIYIVKRDKRMRYAVRCFPLLWSTRMRERAYKCSAPFRVGRGACRIVLTIVNTVTQPVENRNSKLRIIHSVKFYACGSPRA